MRTMVFATALGFTLLLIVCGGIMVLEHYTYDSNISDTGEERSIVVVNKTRETAPCGFGSATQYLILGDDGNVYHTGKWKIYHNMKIGKRYKIKTMRYIWDFSDYWIVEVEEMQSKTNEKEV